MTNNPPDERTEYTINEGQLGKLAKLAYSHGHGKEVAEIVGEIRSTVVELPNSTDLLLIAHDEWIRREARKRIYPEDPWIHGWINGFLTSKKFVRDRLIKLHEPTGNTNKKG